MKCHGLMDTHLIPLLLTLQIYTPILHVISGNFMFFYLWQSTRTWFLYHSPYCFWLSNLIATHPPPSQVSKLRQPISNTWCNHVAFCHSRACLHHSIGRDEPINFQHKLPPSTQVCLFHFWSFFLWLAATDPCTSLWMVHPHFMCMHVCTINLRLPWTNSSMFSTNLPVDQSVYFKDIQHIVRLVPK